MLYSHVLKPEEHKEIREIFAEIGTFGSIRKRVMDDHKKFLETTCDVVTTSQVRSDLFSGVGPTNTPLNAAHFDYLIADFTDLLPLLAIASGKRLELEKRIQTLKSDISVRIYKADNPFATLALDVDRAMAQRRIPTSLCRNFIGYRRSSADGDIIRFSFNIDEPQEGQEWYVRYQNRYFRRGVEWTVEGGGIYATDDTLYLFGHAKDPDGASRGYRIQALRPFGTQGMLLGPIISQDTMGPIAARILLVPYDKLTLTPEQKALGDADKIVRNMVDMNQAMEKSALLAEIDANMTGLLGMDDLYKLISNMTATVIHGTVRENDALVEEELNMRRLCHDHGWSYAEQLLTALRNYNTRPGGT